MFPVGHLLKHQVRDLAKKYRLPTATKKDSQGICFIGEINMKDFLRHYIPVQPGKVLNETGQEIGTHDGALFYTLGERHGFVVTRKGTHDMPYYVIEKNIEHNTITVSQTPTQYETSREVVLEQVVLRAPVETKKYLAQIRYHGEFKSCIINEETPTSCAIIFDESDFSLAGGQSVVMYDGSVCIGGGIVK